ncbi:hypothetical protein HN747_01580 [archaeon]|nr:hypothetical protein [archaeon]
MAKISSDNPTIFLPSIPQRTLRTHWASNFVCPTTGEIMYGNSHCWKPEELEDIRYAIKLEQKAGLSLRCEFTPDANILTPHDPYVILDGGTCFDKSTLNKFFKEEAQLQIGNPEQRKLVDAYEYIELFGKYKEYVGSVE